MGGGGKGVEYKVRRGGAILAILGLGVLLLPLFVNEFEPIAVAVLPTGFSSSTVAFIFIGAGILLLVIDNRSYKSKLARLREAGIIGPTSEATELVETNLVAVNPTLDEIIENRHEQVSEETIRRVFPFYGEILRRQITERYNVIDESIAPRAGVTPDEVGDFSQAVYKAAVAREKQERDG